MPDSYMSFTTQSPKFAPMGFFSPSDGMITINLDEITNSVQDQCFCNSENVLIETIIDVILHEELHKRFDEADDTHDVINEQDERIFKVIRDWVENGKIYSSKY